MEAIGSSILRISNTQNRRFFFQKNIEEHNDDAYPGVASYNLLNADQIFNCSNGQS
jgi:hypothetical protein